MGVYLDGTLLNTFTPTSTTAWSTFVSSLNITSTGDHTIALQAMNSSGDESSFVDNVQLYVAAPPTVTTPATAKLNFATGNTINLSVGATDDGALSQLTYTWTTLGTPPAPVTFSVNGTNAAQNTVATYSEPGTYYFQVTITNLAGLSTTSDVSVGTAPTGVSPIWGTGNVAVSWLPVAGAQTYNVYRATTPSGEGATPIATDITGTSYVDTHVTAGTTYYYEVTSVSSGVESARSFEAMATNGATTPIISEVEAINNTTLADQAGDYPDWIEIYNPAATSVNLAGYYLTDKLTNLTKWEIPAGVTVQPYGFLVLFADGENITNPSELHTNFSLAGAGSSAVLVAPNGTTVLSSYTFSQQDPDISYGVSMAQATGPQGNVITSYGAVGYLTPTPGAFNGSLLALGIAAEPTFSQPDGFYSTSFQLLINSTTPGAQIYYTLDGSAPSQTNGTLYTGPLTISGESNVRAIAIAPGYLPSAVFTSSYIYVAQVIQQEPDGQVPPGWPSDWYGSAVHYGMDAAVVDNPLYSSEIEQDLMDVPVFSITTSLNNLFNPTTGIYSNPSEDLTVPGSVEMINPNGTPGFQANVGLAIHGGYDVYVANDPKRGFRVEFSSSYGESQLNYPLFGPDAAQSFTEFDLRTDQNNSWQYPGNDPQNYTAIDDAFSSETLAALGQPAERSFMCTVYINGQFWGVYDAIERPDENYDASYFGGSASSYDVLKSGGNANGWNLKTESGNFNAWTTLYNLIGNINGSTTPAQANAIYQQIQGNNPDGTPNPDYPDLLDIDNLIQYQMLIYYTGNLDAPNSSFIGNENPNNVWIYRPQDGSTGFQFIATDSEWTLTDPNVNRLNSEASTPSVTTATPQWFFQQLEKSPEFVQNVADHVQQDFFNNGPLTVQATTARFEALASVAYGPVVAESARWGDYEQLAGYSNETYTRDVDWQARIDYDETQYLPVRTGIVLGQLEAAGLFPSVSAPTFSQYGGSVSSGYQLTIGNPNTAGVIYYTLDGTDPLNADGSLSSSAVLYVGPITLNQSVEVKAQVLQNGVGSAATDAVFDIATQLRITELNYDPASPGANLTDTDKEDYEFIELQNFGSQPLDLQNFAFTNGITYTFGNVTLAPGQVGVLVHNLAAFTSGYYGNTSNIDILGSYQSSGTSFSNSGEEVTLVDPFGNTIADFTYSPDWFPTTKGDGPTLEVIDPASNPNLNLASSWRVSPENDGTPGMDDSYPTAAPTGVGVNITNNVPTLTWQAVYGATTYNVYSGSSSGGESTTPLVTGLTSPTFTDAALSFGQTNYYYVTAVDPGGESTASLEVMAAFYPPPPILTTNSGLTAQINQSVTITGGMLSATDPYYTTSQLTYTVTSLPTNGTLLDNGVRLSINSTFTQADINAKLISFTAGNALTDSAFGLTVAGPAGASASGSFSLSIGDSPPQLVTNVGLIVPQGGSGVITTNQLQVTDSDNSDGQLVFTLGSVPAHGALVNTNTHATLAVGGTFTEQDLDNGYVSYQNDNSANVSDGFTFSVSDGAGGTIGTTPFAIAVRLAPVVEVDSGLTTPVGASTFITSSELSTTEVDQTSSQLTYTVTSVPTNGALFNGSTPLTVGSTFTQKAINGTSTIEYVSNAGATPGSADSFEFTVTNSFGAAVSGSFPIRIDQPTSVSYQGGAYSQDFNGLPASGTFTFAQSGPFDLGGAATATPSQGVNATGLAGWSMAQYSGTTTNTEKFLVDTGSGSSTGAVYSYGNFAGDTANAGNLALGLVGTGANASEVGLTLVNNSAVTLNQFSLSYTGQQWLENKNPNTLTFGYAVGASNIVDSSATFLGDANLNYTGTQIASAATGLDGQLAANQSTLSDTVTGLNWAPGQTLVLRWSTGASGSSAGLAIDNLSFSAEVTTQPHVNLTGNSQPITNGSTTTSAANETGFGSTPLGGGPLSETYTITNSGTEALTLGTVTIGGANPGDFTVISQPAVSVPGGGSTTFTVQFAPTASGTRTATVSFTENDPTTSDQFTFAVGGVATVPQPGFTPGDLIVYRVGNASTPAGTSSATPVFLDEYTPSGTLVQSISLPSSISSGLALTDSGKASSNGMLSLSPDSSEIALFGYDVSSGAASATGSAAETVGIVGTNGATQLEGFTDETASNARSAAYDPSTGKLYTSGGLGLFESKFSANGTSTTTTIVSGSTGDVQIINGVVFYTSGASVLSLGGEPTAATASTAVVSDGSKTSPTQFFFARLGTGSTYGTTGADTLYVADSAATNGTLFKYTWNGSKWSAAGSITGPDTGSGNQILGVTGTVSGTTATIYFTEGNTGSGTVGDVYKFTDTYNATISNVTSERVLDVASQQNFRGIVLAPDDGVGAVGALGGTTSYTIGNSATAVGPSATFSDASNFMGGSLRATLSGGGAAADTLGLLAGNNITLTGTTSGNVLYQGNLIGTYTLTSGASSTLTVTFNPVGAETVGNTAANPVSSAAIQALIQQVTFSTSGSGGDRTVSFQVTENGGASDTAATQTVDVASNSQPLIGVTGNSQPITDGASTTSATNDTSFSSTPLGGSALSETYTITNSGTAALTLGTVTIGGANAADFMVTSQPAGSVAVGGTTTFSVQFSPTVGGARNATISFTENDPTTTNPFIFAVSGVATTTAQIGVTGNSQPITDGATTTSATNDTAFGSTPLGGSTLSETYTISNSGPAALTLGTVTIGGINAGDFTVTSQPAGSVAVGGTTTFSVQFSPTAGGARNASVNFSENDPSTSSPFTFAISGVATTTAQISVSGNSQPIIDGATTTSATNDTAFGTTPLGGAMLSETFTITNSGTAPLTVGTVTIGGANAGDFMVTSQPAGSVPVGGNTSFTVQFNPSAGGTRNATVGFSENDPTTTSPFTFAVSGVATTSAHIGVTGNGQPITDGATTTSVTNDSVFGSTPLGGSTLSETYTITNSGTAALTLGTVTIGGANAADFMVTSQPAGSVAVGGTTTFSVQFSPTAGGTRNAIVSFSENDPTQTSPFTFAVSGTAITSAHIGVTGNGQPITDGAATTSATNDTAFGNMLSETYTITNSGTAALTLGTVTIGGTNSGDFKVTSQPAGSVAVGGTSTFSVQFSPTAGGARNAIVSFSENDPSTSSLFMFAIGGVATLPSPISKVSPLSTRQSSLSFPVTVTGNDPTPGPGIASYDIYVSTNGGPFLYWTNVTPSNATATFNGASNTTYAFHSIAHDLSGNIELKSAVAVDASTYVPDLTAPVPQMTATPNTNGTFSINYMGTAPGGSGISSFTLSVKVDGGSTQTIGTYPAGTAVSGTYSGQTTYQGLLDGASHTYTFYVQATNGNGVVSSAVATLPITQTFGAPVTPAVTAFSVEKGLSERSYIRYLDVTFNQVATGLNLNNTTVTLEQFNLAGTQLVNTIDLTGKISLIDHVMEIDFGAGGIGGSENLANSVGNWSALTAADGYYKLLINIDGQTTEEDFYRLFGDVIGNATGGPTTTGATVGGNVIGKLSNADITAIAAAVGQTASVQTPLLNADINGAGIVTSNDRLVAQKSISAGRSLAAGLNLSD